MDHESGAADPAPTVTKAELMARIDGARAAIEEAIAGADPERLTAPGDDGWSVKDHLAHLAAWHHSFLALLEGRPRHTAMGVDKVTYETVGEDGINAFLHERDKDRPLDEVLAAFRGTHEQTLAALEPLTDLDLLRPYSHFQPDEPPFNPAPIVGWIEGNTHEHDEEHLGYIRRLLDRPA